VQVGASEIASSASTGGAAFAHSRERFGDCLPPPTTAFTTKLASVSTIRRWPLRVESSHRQSLHL